MLHVTGVKCSTGTIYTQAAPESVFSVSHSCLVHSKYSEINLCMSCGNTMSTSSMLFQIIYFYGLYVIIIYNNNTKYNKKNYYIILSYTYFLFYCTIEISLLIRVQTNNIVCLTKTPILIIIIIIFVWVH